MIILRQVVDLIIYVVLQFKLKTKFIKALLNGKEVDKIDREFLQFK